MCGLVGGALAGCSAPAGRSASDSGLGGQVDIDGSTTVYPIVQFMAEDFADANSGVKVTVYKSGTGSGFKKFLAGETDIVTASRPIKETEDREAKEKGIDYIEIPVAYDGICIVVNPDFPLTNITTDQLTKMFLQSSRVQSWRDVDPSAPARKINFYGPSDNHGTFEYFQEAILGKNGNFRKDYQPNQEYNTIIQALGQDQEGIGYVGYNYYAENQNKLKALTVNGLAPSVAMIENARRAKQQGKEAVVLYYFCGHGSQYKDQDGDENDGLDETFVQLALL